LAENEPAFSKKDKLVDWTGIEKHMEMRLCPGIQYLLKFTLEVGMAPSSSSSLYCNLHEDECLNISLPSKLHTAQFGLNSNWCSTASTRCP
jgi:hypothetical protein